MARTDYGAILSTVIKDTSDAIREVKGSNALISPAEWGSEIRSISGGGFTPPTNEWLGTPTEFRALANKSDDTLYKLSFDGIVPSAEFIGDIQIDPVNKNFSDYDILVSRINPIRHILIQVISGIITTLKYPFHWAVLHLQVQKCCFQMVIVHLILTLF